MKAFLSLSVWGLKKGRAEEQPFLGDASAFQKRAGGRREGVPLWEPRPTCPLGGLVNY